MASTCLSQNCSSYLSEPIGQTFASSLQLLFAAQCLISENWPPDATATLQDLPFDYIIVGAGSAGSVVAARLSEDACKTVLLIEAGGDPPFASQLPATAASMQKTNVDWQYRTQNDGIACKGLVDGRCNWPRGKMLGGSSSINGNLYVRGHSRNYDDLERSGNRGWNYREALKYFKKSENLTDPNVENDPVLRGYHGYNGPLGVNLFYGTNPVAQSLIDGYEQLSSRVVKDINGPSNYGTVRAQGTIQDGKRESTARAFLVPAKDRPNLIILKNGLVVKININGNAATGVTVKLSNGTSIQASAKSEVIVCAGTINTPQLLMLSGIGPKAHLQSLNIPVISDLAGVGQNLHDHPIVPVTVFLNEGASPTTASQTALDVAQYISNRTGVYSQIGILDILTFINVESNISNYPNIQFHHLFFNTQSPQLVRYCRLAIGYIDQICDSIIGFNGDRQFVNILVTLLDQESRGNVSLASTNPDQPPLIYANYFSSQNDVIKLLKGVRYAERLVNTPSLRAMGAKIRRINVTECNSFKFQSTKYWTCIIFNMGTTVYHPMGTSKMGPPTDPYAVVDPELRVYGVKNLRVIDASVFPGTISGNTNAPTIMVAERGSDLIKQDHKCCLY